MPEAKGTFEITSEPLAPAESTTAIGAGRLAFKKTFHGDLEGTSVVEMLGIMDAAKGSGAYVALERFTGSVLGRKGSFVLMHSSAMHRGVPEQRIAVVPDSGSEQLEGLRASMVITVVEKKHHYVLTIAE